jgi:hypothetical protein
MFGAHGSTHMCALFKYYNAAFNCVRCCGCNQLDISKLDISTFHKRGTAEVPLHRACLHPVQRRAAAADSIPLLVLCLLKRRLLHHLLGSCWAQAGNLCARDNAQHLQLADLTCEGDALILSHTHQQTRNCKGTPTTHMQYGSRRARAPLLINRSKTWHSNPVTCCFLLQLGTLLCTASLMPVAASTDNILDLRCGISSETRSRGTGA